MRTRLVLAAVLGASCVTSGAGAAEAACGRLYIGTHEKAGAPSLFTAGFDGRDGSFGTVVGVSSIERPSWLVKDPARPVLYAVSETGNDGAAQGKVASFRIEPDTGALSPLGEVASGGGGTTHLAFDARSNTLLAAHYGTGHVTALPVGADASLSAPVSVVKDEGTGPSPRQKGPHAHGVVIDPSRRFALVPDLGADRVFVYRFDAARRHLEPAATPFLQLPPGTGPRHLVFGKDGRTVYLLAELTGDLYVAAWDARAGTLRPVQTLSVLAPGYQGKISAGEIIVARGGRQVYVSNRGDSTILAYAVDLPTGRLTEVQRIPSGGAAPWHLAQSPDGRWLLAANEGVGTVTSFRVGPDGRLAATGYELAVVKPAVVVFAGRCSK